MKHGSLFSGIGGFDLAARWMGWENVFHVEKDEFCQKVLKKNFPKSKQHGDIYEFNGKEYHGAIDIISGGFPCQPFSNAGKQKGAEDDRHLWPEMLRVVREIQPSWVIGENVPGITMLELDNAISDLESLEYSCQAFAVPAVGVGTPHKRERIFIVAYSGSLRRKKSELRTTPHRKKGTSVPSTESLLLGNWPPGPGKESRISRTINGISRGVDKDRVRALGNAVVPQLAYHIFKSIVKINQHSLWMDLR